MRSAYLVRYTVAVPELGGQERTFFHNPNTLQQNLHEQASGIISPALVIHDEWNARKIAKIYQQFSKTVEILEAKLAVGTMVYYGPTDPETISIVSPPRTYGR